MPLRYRKQYLPTPMVSFLDYWVERMRPTSPPIRNADFSPTALKPWLGHLALIERAEDGNLRFRLAGTMLLKRFGTELTGKDFRDIDAGILGELENDVLEAMTIAAPVVQNIVREDDRLKFYDLIAPLADVNGQINLVILVSFWEPWASSASETPGGHVQSSGRS